MLTLNLIGGDIYYLEAFRYGTPYAYTLRIGYNPASTQEIVEGLPYSVTTASDSYQMLKFVPSMDGYYEFYSSKTSGNPQIFVFAPQGYLMGSDDDSGGNQNAYLDCYLEADVTYYIAVQGYNGNATACSVEVWALS